MSEPDNSNAYDGSHVTVERALPEDAEAISKLLRRTWLATYPNAKAGITEEDIRLRTDGENGERIPTNIANWRGRIEAKDGTGAVYVARLDNEVIGMAGPGIMDGIRHVGALYVSPDAQGKGVGSLLMEKILEWHGDKEDIYLNVASYNQKAISFYERFGFVKTNTPVIDEGNVFGNTRIPEIEMVKRASQPST